MIASDELVIGVDGGGTKTVAWLVPLAGDADQPPLGRGSAGPGNPRAVGFEAAQANILVAISDAFTDAGLPPCPVAAACFGLAGAGRTEEQERIALWAKQQLIAGEIKVVADAELVLAAGSPDGCGIALVAGTGSLAWGRNSAGQTARCGGWGYLLGDEGSGYRIALAGLQAAVRAADGRGPETSLLVRFQNALQATSPAGIIERIYAPEMTRRQIAALAGVVFDAEADDEVARRLVESAARELAATVIALAHKLDIASAGFPLALAGGVLVHQPKFRERVLAALASQGVKPVEMQVVLEPVAGAVRIARKSQRAS